MAEMTKNDRVILLSAKEDFQDGRYNQVINKTEHLLEKYPQSLELNDLYAIALYALKRYPEAFKIVEEFADELMAQPKYQEHLLKIFLSNHLFMLAREVLAQASERAAVRWQGQINQAEDAFRATGPADLAAQTRKFAYLGALPVEQQVHEVKSALKLPLREYVSAAKTILSDAFGWQVSKTQVLLQLMKVQVSENVDFVWLDGQTHTISTDELKPLEESVTFVDVLQKVEQKFAADDPIKLELLEKELFTQSNYIYPYFDRVITNPSFWATAIIAQSFGEPVSAKGPEEKQMLSWIDQIHNQEIKIGLI
ncbi:hypothetical protein ABC628_11300 [Lentilactobacillus otakiensis]|uniref:TPR repeat-containing protein n=1 Tax=Lentilactobacillus otakiensis DSM 19908 = JCM 15040 TaxID=1423780 RepID=S4NNQ9_9LACO|nr:hypothetical protein [Lentilactobacillus otakiensis]MBZ3777610.1 hypothetical protein [Lentilactobacillus otakiensis]MDV3518711.1 hypothetical protein [Lentilactobacillus otakiensis]GAD17471.1 hypothetical protein LOT_2009 [Lentilactobacillus otakiensis DSM 19908 = JCM 15040]